MPTLIEQRSYENFKREKDNILIEDAGDDSRPSESNEMSNEHSKTRAKDRRPKSQRSEERQNRLRRQKTQDTLPTPHFSVETTEPARPLVAVENKKAAEKKDAEKTASNTQIFQDLLLRALKN